MALRDALAGFIDNVGLKSTFETKPRDPVKARQPVLRGIERTRDQVGNSRTRAPNRWWSEANGVAAFSPQINGWPLLINAQTTNYLPSDRFGEFLDAFRQAVEAGEFDAEIEQIERGDGAAGGSARVPMLAKKRVISEGGRENMRKAAQARAERRREGVARGD